MDVGWELFFPSFKLKGLLGIKKGLRKTNSNYHKFEVKTILSGNERHLAIIVLPAPQAVAWFYKGIPFFFFSKRKPFELSELHSFVLVQFFKAEKTVWVKVTLVSQPRLCFLTRLVLLWFFSTILPHWWVITLWVTLQVIQEALHTSLQLAYVNWEWPLFWSLWSVVRIVCPLWPFGCNSFYRLLV